MSTPLSDQITRSREAPDAASYRKLLEVYIDSELGVIGGGVPEGTEGLVTAGPGVELTVGQTELPDGRVMVLACADFPVFIERYGGPFNATMSALALSRLVLALPGCKGVRINSAASEDSVIIDRATLKWMVRDIDRVLNPRPWWKFW